MSRPEEVRVFAPASLSNMGPGFDVLGLALTRPGDIVLARRVAAPGVRIVRATGGVPTDVERNTAGVAARETLRRAGMMDVGIELEVEKGMAIGTGLGSSAASAAAAAVAVNLLLGAPLRKQELVGPCVEAEASVAGRHGDNVSPSLLGGLCLVRSVDPADVIRIPVPEGMMVVVASPAFELSTKIARAALPDCVPLRSLVKSTANIAALVAACYAGDVALLARSLDEDIVVPVRAGLIPGATEVMAAAREAGALGSTISGAGPSIFALCHSEARAVVVGEAMKRAFLEHGGLESEIIISVADAPGARPL
ncbi:MAG TPA: homoserine kinase [Longimicrobiales bacterium]